MVTINKAFILVSGIFLFTSSQMANACDDIGEIGAAREKARQKYKTSFPHTYPNPGTCELSTPANEKPVISNEENGLACIQKASILAETKGIQVDFTYEPEGSKRALITGTVIPQERSAKESRE